MKVYTPYQEKIRNSFAVAFRFLDEHREPQTQEDIERIVDNLSAIGKTNPDRLTLALIVVAFEELERYYVENDPAKEAANG